jgi:uncharacterized coiled-coil protein SlyX
MAFSKDRFHELEIACAIQKTSIHALSSEWNCSDTWLRMVARGSGVSERIEKKIDDYIKGAKEVIPFEYPYQKVA